MEGWDYCWPCEENNYSGKGLQHATFKKCADCSGAVTIALWAATEGRIDLRATHNAQALYTLSQKLSGPEEALPGDLVFYGPGKNAINHVMVCIEPSLHGDYRVFGACGGDSKTTTPELAKKIGARVRYRNRINYRPDFRAIGRI